VKYFKIVEGSLDAVIKSNAPPHTHAKNITPTQHLHEFQRLVITVDDDFLSENVMIPLSTCLHNGVHLFVVGGIPMDNIRQCFTIIGNNMYLMSEDDTNNIV
jgi:hypothetical protein